MHFQALKLNLPQDRFRTEVATFYQVHAHNIVRAVLNLAMNTAVAGSEDEAIDMIQAGCDSIVVLGQENIVWQGIDGIVAATFADLDVLIPESEAATAFFEAVTPGMIKDVITIISGAFEAMDELSEGLG